MPSEYEFELPFPPSINTLRACVRNRLITSKKGREYFASVNDLMKALKLHGENMQGELSVIIKLYPPTLRKFDIDNYAKSILDSLTKCDFWGDDSQVTRLTLIKMNKFGGGKAEVKVSHIL